MRDVRERLLDIQEAIERIDRYAAQGRTAFDSDELIQTWIVHHLVLIGEACAALPADVRVLAPAIPWQNIVGMRTILVLAYFAIDHVVVWGAVEKELPPLRNAVSDLLARLAAP